MQDIIIRDISKSYDGKIILNRYSLVIPGGGTTVLMGPSGCGKTTLLSVLMGLEEPESGSVQGVPDRFGVVFQENRLCEEATAYENVAMVIPGRHRKDSDIIHAFEAVGIEECMDMQVLGLSGGQKRRVAILRALMYDAQTVVMDEPFTALDADSRQKTMAYVKSMCAGRTLFMVTHDITEAEYMSDNIIQWQNISTAR